MNVDDVGGATVRRYGDDVGEPPVTLRRRDAAAHRLAVRVELRPRCVVLVPQRRVRLVSLDAAEEALFQQKRERRDEHVVRGLSLPLSCSVPPCMLLRYCLHF